MLNEEQGHCLKAASVALPSKEGGGETCPVHFASERVLSVQSLSSDCYMPRNSLTHSLCPGPGKLFPA